MAEENKDLSLISDETDYQKVAEEMARSISKMYEERDKKALGAKKHLVSQLLITSDKYRTANGVMSALETVRSVAGSHNNMSLEEEISMAKSVATSMARIASNMANEAKGLDPEELENLCDGFYNKDFAQGDDSAIDMVAELMMLQLCQNVGPNASDIVEFINQSDKEIEKARNDLRTLCADHDIDFTELCGPYEDCYYCLCEMCANDCKEHREIRDDMSALDVSVFDVCENFVKKED